MNSAVTRPASPFDRSRLRLHLFRLAFAAMVLLAQPGTLVNVISGGRALAQPNEVKEVIFPDPPPKAPVQSDQIEYFSVPDSKNRYWLDLASLALLENDTVRFSTLVVSESGVRNLRHEAFRCASSERRLLGIGRNDGTWSITSGAPWQPIRLGSHTNLGYPELFRALCFGGANVDPKQVAEKIRTGPKVGNF